MKRLSLVIICVMMIITVSVVPSFAADDQNSDLSRVADELISVSECPVYEQNQGRAFYNITKDEIILPVRKIFKDEASFVKTLVHEMTHSTGASSRLNRDYGHVFGEEKYAREELVAEHYEDHSDYLKSWISSLKNDYSIFFTAVADAEKVAERIMGRYKGRYAPKIEQIAEKSEEIMENRTIGENYIR